MTAPEASFDEPWQAQLFALTVAMNEAGHFTWAEWAEVFGPKVQSAEATIYWDVWSQALITLLQDKGIADPATVHALTKDWQAAARATPHGQPITLGQFP